MAAIFDMDGLLLDTEPLWGQSMQEVAASYQVPVTYADLKHTTGLRIYEVTAFWAERFPWPGSATSQQIAEDILDNIIAKAKQYGRIMPGAKECLLWMRAADIKIGLATSSPMRMLNALIDHFDLRDHFDALLSADSALSGKPHPEVFLQCAHALNIPAHHCIALEDSVNGMIAAKAARMKAIVVPEAEKYTDKRFGLADLKLRTLEELTPDMWHHLHKS